MRVLVVYGSRMGGTEEIARIVAEEMSTAFGYHVDVREGHELDGLDVWDAVIVGGALYAGRWQRRARRFVERHVHELRHVPTFFFSSGPLDDSASSRELPATPQVARLIERVVARDHITFGGRLKKSASGLIAKKLAEKHAGDFRNPERIQTWAHSVGERLEKLPAREAVPTEEPPMRTRRRVRWLVGALCLFTGVSAIPAGLGMVFSPEGGAGLPPIRLLEGTPFADFFVPGLLLFGAVGLVNLLSGVSVLRRQRFGSLAAAAAGAILIGWILVEMVMLSETSWLQDLYLGVGFITLFSAGWLWMQRRAATGARQIRPLPAYL